MSAAVVASCGSGTSQSSVDPSAPTTALSTTALSTTAPPAVAQLMWTQTADGWQASQPAPECPSQPMLRSLVDITAVTSVLYPGQVRGRDYKPHGGFRFDNSPDNAVEVSSPLDGFLVRGARYLVEGETQYTFDVFNNCGIMYRVGHLRELPANLQSIVETWPEPSDNSASQSIMPPIFVAAGEVLATKVGLLNSHNTFFDFGVYDYRRLNEASGSAEYRSMHPDGTELAFHAVCWLSGWMPLADEAVLSALPPGDAVSGSASDYCG